VAIRIGRVRGECGASEITMAARNQKRGNNWTNKIRVRTVSRGKNQKFEVVRNNGLRGSENQLSVVRRLPSRGRGEREKVFGGFRNRQKEEGGQRKDFLR